MRIKTIIYIALCFILIKFTSYADLFCIARLTQNEILFNKIWMWKSIYFRFFVSTTFSIFDCKQINIITQYNRHLKQHKINFRCNSIIMIRRQILLFLFINSFFKRNINNNMKLMVVKKGVKNMRRLSALCTASNMMNCNKNTKSQTYIHTQTLTHIFTFSWMKCWLGAVWWHFMSKIESKMENVFIHLFLDGV